MRSKKAFAEVFPTFKTQDEEITDMFSDVFVERVTSNPERTKIDVYIESPHTIHKKIIMKTERELKNIFPSKIKVSFYLHERFVLSDKYNAELLLDEYGLSMLYELKVREPILFGLYKSANRYFNEKGEYVVVLPDTVIAHNMEGELLRFLNMVFDDRCGIRTTVKVDYKYEEKSTIRKEAEFRIQKEIEEISARLNVPETENKSVSKPKKSSSYKEGRKYTKKKSDDPDVIFRSDVPEQSMDISDIDGEMDDVVVRASHISG